MSRRRGQPGRMQAALLLACLAMGWLLLRELSADAPVPASAFSVTAPFPDMPPEPPESATGADAPVFAPVFAMDPVERFEAVVARTMFAPARRPPAAAPLAMPAGTVRPVPVLTGIVGSPGGPMALLGMVGSRPMRARVGEAVDGWTVVAIGDGHVVLGRDGETATIALAWDGVPAAVMRGPAPATPPATPRTGATASPGPEPPVPAALPAPGMLP